MLLSVFRECHYLPWARAELRPNSLEAYERTWALHVRPAWGATEMADIGPVGVMEWLESLSNGIRAKCKSNLSAILQRAVSRGLIPHNPCRDVVARRAQRRIPRTLSAAELRRLLRGFWGHGLEPWLIVSANCGLRREEACALPWGDVDLRSGAVTVDRTLQTAWGAPYLGEPKTELSRRVVPLPRYARDRMRDLKGAGYLTSGTDEPLSPDAVRKRYERHCKSHDLPYVPPRNLRHTWATLAVEAGAGAMVVASMLGHADMATTYRYYIAPRLSAYHDAQDRFQALLFKAAR